MVLNYKKFFEGRYNNESTQIISELFEDSEDYLPTGIIVRIVDAPSLGNTSLFSTKILISKDMYQENGDMSTGGHDSVFKYSEEIFDYLKTKCDILSDHYDIFITYTKYSPPKYSDLPIITHTDLIPPDKLSYTVKNIKVIPYDPDTDLEKHNMEELGLISICLQDSSSLF